MYANNITTATEELQDFGFRSQIYSYFFLCASTLSLIIWTIQGVHSLNAILTGVCLLLIPTAIYFSGSMVETLTDKILSCQVSTMDEFDTSFRGPFSGVSWVIFSLTFFLASAEVLFDAYFEQAFGMYSLFLVAFTLTWLGRFYTYFRRLKLSVYGLRGHADSIDLKDVPANKRGILAEAQRGNTETLVDKRDELASL